MKSLKNVFLAALLVVLAMMFSFALVACGEPEEEAHAHTLTHHAKVDATCTTAGTKEYWSCEGCGKNFSDAQGKTEVTDLALPAGHKLTKHDEVKSTCKVAGNPTYWSCETCKKNFSDAEGKTETTEITSPLAAHTLSKVEAVAQTCVKDGNTEHWHCSVCGKDFEDKDGKTEAANVVLKADGKSHKYEDNETEGWTLATPANCTDNAVEKRECLNDGCDHEETREVEGSAKGHNYDKNGVCQNEGCTDTNGPKDLHGVAPVKRKDGKVEFGSYPQTQEKDATITAQLNTLAGTHAEPAEGAEWKDYQYWKYNRLATETSGNEGADERYMFYVDVTYNEETYRGVEIIDYRPYQVTSGPSSNNQETNGYTKDKVYWFKYEPILWTELEEEDGVSLLLSDLIIDSQAFSTAYKSSDWNTGFNNYKNSSIRTFLNDTFYNAAFTASEQAYIETTEVDNSEDSTMPVLSSGTVKTNKWICDNTEDNIFLLSHLEVATMYGLGEDNNASEARIKHGTDYAKAQGLAVDTTNGASLWYTRSPHYNSNLGAYMVGAGGQINLSVSDQKTYNTNVGVVPALRIHFETAQA